MKQTESDKKHIIENLPEGTKRVKVLTPSGKEQYKRPDDVDLVYDEIPLTTSGAPIVMRGKPGRKTKTVRKAVSPQIEQTCEAREDHVAGSGLTNSVKGDPSSDRVIESILMELAHDAAVLDFETEEAARMGGDVSGLLTKKARLLKGMSDIWLRKKSLDDGGLVDLESTTFEALFALILETFKDVLLDAGVHDEHIETIFTKLVGSFDDNWKEEAKTRMRQERTQ